MIPARDRLTKLYVYDTEADMLDDLNGTEYTSGVVDGSQRFEHTFFNAFPSFGEANAAMYQCDISGTGDLTGKYIRVKYSYYATASASTRTDRWLFAGKVDKCTYDRYKTVRSLTAYDKLYELRSVDISAWWTTYWASQSTDKTYAQFVVDMCSAFGVTTDWQNLTDASGTIVYATAKNLRLAGCSFVEMLRYIGQLTRYSWFILANGKLGRSYLHNNIWQRNIDDAIDTSTTEYGDEPLPAYASVMAYDGADVIYTYGSGSPTWTIRDNPLLKGKTTSQIATELDSLRSKLAVTAGYYPLTADMIVSSPDDLNIGYDNLLNVKTTDGTLTRKHVIAGIRLWGPQLINQQIICPHEMEQGDSLSPSMSAALSEIQKMGVEMTYKVNADNVIEAVNLEASDTVKIQARALDINGAISANGNTKINTDGTLEAVNGKFSGQLTSQTGTIGGFNLANNKIYKRSGATPAEAQYHNGVEIISDYEPAIAIGGRTGGLTPQGETEVVQILQNRFGISVERGYDNGGDAGGAFVAENMTQITGAYISMDDGDNETFIDPTSLVIADRDILRTHQSLVGGYGTEITANKDLNTTEFLSVRRFLCQYDSNAGTLVNCPTRYAFMMDVFAPIDSNLDNSSYIVREIRTRYGDKYVQYVTGSTTKTYSKWVMQLSNASDNTVFADQIFSRNFANNASIRNGSFDGQGQETSSNTRIRTGYFGVLPNTQYGIRTNYSTLQIYEVHEYTSSRTFIKYTSVNNSSTILKTSSTTGYIRVLMRYSDNRILTPDEGAKLQIERGEQLSAYSPNQSYSDRIIVPFYTYSDLGTATTDSAFFQAWLKRIAVNYDYFAGKVIEGRVQPNGTGAVFGHLYGGVNANGMPNYCGFSYVSVGVLKYFGTNNGVFYLRSVNYTSEV